jgi:hypothetical protein
MGRALTGWVGASGLDEPAIRLVARQTPGPMEHRQGTIRIVMHPHRDLHVMEPMGILWNLQTQALIPDGVVLGHDPLLLHSQDFGEMRANPRDVGGARFRRPHHTPTSASWLNLVERWFGEITRKRIRRGVFTSVPELVAAIDELIRLNNKNPKPFVWTKTVDDILKKIKHCKAVIETPH